jgi:hypothetical protein
MKHTTSLMTAAAALASAVLLVACGGGSSDAAPAAIDAVPDSASASPEGMVAYLGELAKALPDEREPLDIAGWKPPTSETAEPVALQ